MLTTRYVTIDTIMEIIHDDYGFNPERSKVAEWIWRVVGYLGIPYGKEEKIIDSTENELFKVADFRSLIPIDLYKLTGIKHRNLNANLKRATGMYHINKLMESAVVTSLTIEGENVIANDTDLDFDNTAYVSGATTLINSERLVFSENNGYFYYGFKSGDIVISYEAFPIDQYGYPKVPDDAKYIRAVTSFIARQIGRKMKLQGSMSRTDYNDLLLEYGFAAGAAKTSALTPDESMMESIKQLSSRLLPLYNHHGNGFETIGNVIHGIINTNTNEV